MSIQPPVLLTGYDAKRCQRRVHNDHDPTIPRAPWEPSPDVRARMDAGIAFEAEVFNSMKATLPTDRWRDLSSIRGKTALIAATVAAMDEGVELLLGGWLPDDTVAGRTGRPDLLLKVGNGYIPGDVKGHKIIGVSKTGSLTYSPIASPTSTSTVDGIASRTSRLDDYLQLAHYWRMLAAAGRVAHGPARGFIIGTDDLTDQNLAGPLLAWLPLEDPLFETFSRSQGKAKRTALERYDFEFGIRAQIAQVAAVRTGSNDDPDPLVPPIFSEECDSCPWFDYCTDLAGDSASAHFKVGRLDLREWRALGALGVRTVEELAALNIDDPTFQAQYLPEVTHQGNGALGRLTTAARRARMLRDGVALERTTTGPIDLPRADVEIDFDLEDAEGHTYIWGAALTASDGTTNFEPTVSWDPMDSDCERALAQQFVDWLRAVRDKAAARGETTLAYHYTGYETQVLKRLLGEEAIADVLPLMIDLYAIVAEHYFGAKGLGLKKVAPAYGFQWRDDEPNGLLSQLWYVEAITSDDPDVADAARKRILEYNEDDVLATLAVRRGIANTQEVR